MTEQAGTSNPSKAVSKYRTLSIALRGLAGWWEGKVTSWILFFHCKTLSGLKRIEGGRKKNIKRMKGTGAK